MSEPSWTSKYHFLQSVEVYCGGGQWLEARVVEINDKEIRVRFEKIGAYSSFKFENLIRIPADGIYKEKL